MTRREFLGKVSAAGAMAAFDRARGELSVSVPAKSGVRYRIRFIVTPKGAPLQPERTVDVPPTKEHRGLGRTVPVYDARIGETAELVEGRPGVALAASYRLRPDDLYVRARVESDEPALYSRPNRLHPKVKVAWTQPYAKGSK